MTGQVIDTKVEAQKIWDQIDQEEGSGLNSESRQPAADQPSEAPAPAPKADAPQAEEEPLSPREQMLMDRVNGLQSTIEQVTGRLRNAEGHIGGLNNQLKQQLEQAQKVQATGGEAPTAREIRDAQANPQAMEALKRDYPEFATAMQAALDEQLRSVREQISNLPKEPRGDFVSAQEMQVMRAELAVEARHPGWQETVQKPEFQGWLQRQAREVQMLAGSPHPADAVRLLDIHKESTANLGQQNRNQRLASAAAISGNRQAPRTSSKSVEEMTPAEYWRYLDQLDTQKKG